MRVALPDGFAAAGGHDDQAIPPTQDILYDLTLVPPECGVPEIALHTRAGFKTRAGRYLGF